MGIMPFSGAMVEASLIWDGRRRALSGAGTETPFEERAAKPGLELGGIGELRPAQDGIQAHRVRPELVCDRTRWS